MVFCIFLEMINSVKLKKENKQQTSQNISCTDNHIPLYDRRVLIHFFYFFFFKLRTLLRFFLAFYIQCPLAPSESIREGSVNFAVNK